MMPNGILTPKQFEELKDEKVQIKHVYGLVYTLYKRRHWNSIKDGASSLVGGFLGAIVFLKGFTFWK